MERLWLVAGAVSAALSVAAGAFGAHGLRQRLSPDLLAVFESGHMTAILERLAELREEVV